MSAKATKKQASEANVFEAAGIDLSDLQLPFIKVTSSWQRVTIHTVRKPSEKEAWKKLDGQDPFPVYAILGCVDSDGQEAEWDITSKLLRNQLAKLVGHKVPADVRVKRTGKPPRTVYRLERYTPTLDEHDDEGVKLCLSPDCTQPRGHKGAHVLSKDAGLVTA